MLCLLFLCFPFLVPRLSPYTDSQVMPDGSLRPYAPAIDGIMAPDGRVYFPAAYPPTGRRHGRPAGAHASPRAAPFTAFARARTPKASGGGCCYGQDGQWQGDGNPECAS